ncbi:MAG: SpoIIE family protein phosphatase [Spirochaetales bacterium]|nr:SpoIIE family protein phosphatase [Spirochaetales bacterium]
MHDEDGTVEPVNGTASGPNLFGPEHVEQLAALQLRLLGAEPSGDGTQAHAVSSFGSFEAGIHLVLPNQVSSASFVLPGPERGGAIGLFKCSGRGLVPAFQSQDLAARFSERFKPNAGARELKAFVEEHNDALLERRLPGRFAMLGLGVISQSGESAWLSAGGPDAYLYREDTKSCRKLKLVSGPPLGMMPSMMIEMQGGWKAFKLPLERGDLVFFPSGDWDEVGIPPIVEAALERTKSEGGYAPLPSILAEVLAGLEKAAESVDGFEKQGDRFVALIRKT